MSDSTEGASSKPKHGFFYPTDESLDNEITRFLKTRKNNRGAFEHQIESVLKATPFAKAKVEADEDPNSTKDDKLFFREMRRETMLPVIKKLWNQGSSVKEISEALLIPYATAWYHCNKIRNHIRTRRIEACWKIDTETPGNHLKRVKMTRDQRAIAAEKEIIRKAKEKRKRRLARRSLEHAKQTQGEAA